MTQGNDPKALAEFIYCLSFLEDGISQLYRSLSSKIELPLVRSLLDSIAEDSLKHSTLLKGVGGSIAEVKEKPRDCQKKTDKVWKVITAFSKEIASKEKLSKEEISQLADRLSLFESTVGEEYYIFVQMKTLQLMMKEINRIYNVDLGSLKSIFTRIIGDEERHRETLQTIKVMITKRPEPDNTPVVKYQNPDAWISYSPPRS